MPVKQAAEPKLKTVTLWIQVLYRLSVCVFIGIRHIVSRKPLIAEQLCTDEKKMGG
jgi:hypothetical protein